MAGFSQSTEPGSGPVKMIFSTLATARVATDNSATKTLREAIMIDEDSVTVRTDANDGI